MERDSHHWKSSLRKVIVFASLSFLLWFLGDGFANTLFVADRGRETASARGVDFFHIDETPTISYIGTLDFSSGYGYGPIDFAMDEAQQIVFVSFETINSAGERVGTCKISLIDFNTLTRIKDIEFPYADDFGGLCYDPQRQRLYAVERNTNQVYILKWNPANRTLEYEQLIQLSNIQYACAIQVDGDMAYVTEFWYRSSQYFTHIKQYDISRDWAYVRTIPNERDTVCLAYDAPQGIFYSGAYSYTNENNYHYIIKHSLSPDEIIVKSNTGSMIDGDIDESNGYLYITSYRGSGLNCYGVIEIWNTSGWTSDPNQTIAPLAVYDNASILTGPAGILFVDHDRKPVKIKVTKEDGLNPNEPNDWILPGDIITYTVTIDPNDPNGIGQTGMIVTDYLPPEVDYEEELNIQPATPPADPNVVFGIKDANDLTDIILPVGQSIRLYLTKETFEEDVFSFYLEANISDPNLGWIDNTEYDPNDPGTAEILAQPRASFFDYYGPGCTQPEGIQFIAVSFGGAMEDGDLASFVYTATQPGYVVLTLVDYNAIPATLEEMVIHQTDPNDPNYMPGEPNELSAPPASSVPGVYDEPTHTVIWNLGSVIEPVTLTLTVRVNNKAEPRGTLLNEVVAESDTGFGWGYEETRVGCFGGGIIYVDITAAENGNGTSWDSAYRQLSDALPRAAKGCGVTEIWLAQGVYSPGPKVTDTFEIPSGKSVYGGFVGDETSRDQRNPKLYPTVLTGYIRTINGIEERNRTIVTMGNNSLLDGVTLEKGDYYGIYGNGINFADGINFAVRNCHIQENGRYGIWCQNGNVEVIQTSVCNNEWDGIYHYGSNYTLAMENCTVSNNQQNGINCLYSTPTIINSLVYRNGADGTTYSQYYGVKIANPVAKATLRNNTIVCNQNAGVYYTGNTANSPKVKNCIVWRNAESSGFGDIEGFTDTIHCCLTDPNHPDDVITNPTSDAAGNIVTSPDFAYSDLALSNFHLAYNSPCVNAGDPNETDDLNETDMDGEIRVYGTSIDIGADEAYSCDDNLRESDIYDPMDWNADGIVNYAEFSMLSHSWLAVGNPDPNFADPNYNPVCDVNSDWEIDTGDLVLFTPHWLWVACWRHDIQEMRQQAQQSMMSISLTTESTSTLQSESVLTETSSVQTIEPLVVQSVAPVPIQESPVEPVQPEKSIEEQIADLQEAIQLLESIGNDPNTQLEIQALDWQEFMDEVRNSLTELQEKDIITQDKVED